MRKVQKTSLLRRVWQLRKGFRIKVELEHVVLDTPRVSDKSMGIQSDLAVGIKPVFSTRVDERAVQEAAIQEGLSIHEHRDILERLVFYRSQGHSVAIGRGINNSTPVYEARGMGPNPITQDSIRQ